MSWKTKHSYVFTLYTSIVVLRLWHAIIDVLFSVTIGVNTRHIVTVNMELGFSEIMLWSCSKCINTQTGNQKQLVTPAAFSVFKQKKNQRQLVYYHNGFHTVPKLALWFISLAGHGNTAEISHLINKRTKNTFDVIRPLFYTCILQTNDSWPII